MDLEAGPSDPALLRTGAWIGGEWQGADRRFAVADPARARTTGGSGLGLSIATEDARLHGAWLQACSKIT